MMIFPLVQTIDGEAAVSRARDFLHRMGVRNPGELDYLGEQPASAWQQPGMKVWGIGFGGTGDAHGNYYVSVDERGEVFRAGRIGPDGPSDAAKNAEAMKRFQRRLMSRVPHALPVRSHRPAESFYADGQFDVIVRGLRFFNLNPSYAYRVYCDPRGAFVGFSRAPIPPPVVSPKPRLGKEAALPRLVARWGKREHEGPFPQHLVPELGYYLVQGERTARLVWRGWVYSDAHPLFDGASTVHGFIDANTGAYVPPNPND